MSTIRSTYHNLTAWLQEQLVFQKLNNPTGYLLMIMIAGFSSIAVTWLGLKPAALLVVFLLGAPLMILSLLNLRFGLALALIAAFMINFLAKYTYQPVGVLLDGLLLFMLFSTVVHISIKRDWVFPKSAISVIIIIWIAYNMLEAFNPEAASRKAWLYTVRSLAILQLFFFIACYAIQNLKQAKNFIKLILGLGLISALYGIKQEHFGYSGQEWAWMYQSPTRYQLIVQWDRYRAFSFFSDPTTFGTLMAYLGSFSFVLATGPFSRQKKGMLIAAGLLMYLAMAYAGSRTPFIIIPMGVLLFTLIRLNKKVLLATGIFFFVGAGLIMKSTTSPVIYRMQSAFKPGKSASVQLRLKNQKMVQPYIQTHPFGAGLGSTGIWGERFSPDSWLAGFPHDSAYVRVAIELGWLGLLIYLLAFFIAFRTALYYYFRVRDPKIKVFYLGSAIIILMLALASYPQEVVTLLPNNIVYYILLAIIVKLKDFDREPEEVV